MKIVDRFLAKYPQKKIIRGFRNICRGEALSWMLLIAAMTWIRYEPEGQLPTLFIIIIGNLHGLFFTLYLLFILPMKKIFSWDDEDFVFALISAFFPLATIWVDKKLAQFNRE